MNVRDIMTAPVESIQSTDTIQDAARKMAENDIGSLPVLSDEKLVGIVTDRDIAVRAVATGLPASDPVNRVMSENVATCSPDDDLASVRALMSGEQIRRMPVCNDRQHIVGIVALGDLAEREPNRNQVGETLANICEPSGQHCQTPELAQ